MAPRPRVPVESGALTTAKPGNGAPAARLPPAQVRWLPLQRRARGFTLTELTVGVVGLLVFLLAQLLNTAANVITLGHKQMDADAQTRQLLDRIQTKLSRSRRE